MKKFLALTTNIGNYDNLSDPKIGYDNTDYIAVVDKINENSNLKIWKQKLNSSFSSIDNYKNRRDAKVYKVLSTLLFNDYEYIIWMDANHNLDINPEDLLSKYGDADLYIFQHPHRNCLYDEMNEVIKGRLDSEELINRQKDFYLKEKMPSKFGLPEMTCFIKKNTHGIKSLEFMWWEQICKYSSRDQCSISYCLWKLSNSNVNLRIKKLSKFANLYAGGNDYFTEKEGHLK